VRRGKRGIMLRQRGWLAGCLSHAGITGCAVAQRTVITATSVSYGKNGNFDPL